MSNWKVMTYFRYFYEYLKHGDILSIQAAVNYLLFKKSHSNDRIIKTTTGVFFCRKNTNDFQYANYAYEWSVKKYILDHYHEYNVFIDGGACVGEYCVMLSKRNIRCMAFEPVKDTFDVLTKNLELNDLSSKIRSFPFGLGEQNELAHFAYNPINTGASHIVSGSEASNREVVIRTFDSVVPELNLESDDRILFKLDIEGMEPEAIRGAKDFIQQYPNITFVVEDKHCGNDSIKNTLAAFASFEFGRVDEFNIYAKKIN